MVNSTMSYGTFECVFPTCVQHGEEMSSNRILCCIRRETLFLLEIQQWSDNFPPSERTISRTIKMCLGALQRKKNPKIRDYYGSGWVGPGLTRNVVCVWKIVPK